MVSLSDLIEATVNSYGTYSRVLGFYQNYDRKNKIEKLECIIELREEEFLPDINRSKLKILSYVVAEYISKIDYNDEIVFDNIIICKTYKSAEKLFVARIKIK